MKKTHIYYIIVPIFIAMLLMILDSKTAVIAVSDGIDICLKTVIPSLFPFIFLSALLTGALYGYNPAILRPLGAILGVPHGCEGLLIVSALGGYPIGAKCIAQAYDAGSVTQKTAARMIGFCNNAGPAFIFGMIAHLFDAVYIPWILWMIHLLSAFLVGIVTPKVNTLSNAQLTPKTISITSTVEQSIKTMAMICGWIVLFKIIIHFADRWFMWLLPQELSILLAGLLELSNGCVSLHQIVEPGPRFILCSAMIGFGGICVHLQTITIARKIHTRMYIVCKLLQCSISVFIATIVQHILFSLDNIKHYSVPLLIISGIQIAISLLFLRKNENNSRKTLAAHV